MRSCPALLAVMTYWGLGGLRPARAGVLTVLVEDSSAGASRAGKCPRSNRERKLTLFSAKEETIVSPYKIKVKVWLATGALFSRLDLLYGQIMLEEEGSTGH